MGTRSRVRAGPSLPCASVCVDRSAVRGRTVTRALALGRSSAASPLSLSLACVGSTVFRGRNRLRPRARADRWLGWPGGFAGRSLACVWPAGDDRAGGEGHRLRGCGRARRVCPKPPGPDDAHLCPSNGARMAIRPKRGELATAKRRSRASLLAAWDRPRVARELGAPAGPSAPRAPGVPSGKPQRDPTVPWIPDCQAPAPSV